MSKKIFALIALTLVFICMFSACKVSDEKEGTTKPSAISFTTQPEQFFGKIPNYDFKKAMNVVADSSSYSMNVKCTKAEYDEYMVLLKQCGFILEVYEDGGQYEAKNADGMSAEVAYNAESHELYAAYIIYD